MKHESRIHSIRHKELQNEPRASCLNVETIFERELKTGDYEQKPGMEFDDGDKNEDGSLSSGFNEKYINELWNKIDPHQCIHCMKPFESAYLLYQHYNAEHPDLKSDFSCNRCSEQKSFQCIESYINHVFTTHYEHLRYCCFICNESYWNHTSMYHHFKKAHGTHYKVLICLLCGKHQKSGFDLKTHVYFHRNSAKFKELKGKAVGNLQCDLCDRQFSRQYLYDRHKKAHERNEGRVWVCENCGKHFTAKSTLINHYMVHQTEKNFPCDFPGCGEAFKNKYKLKHHKGLY
jgi:KRAB domain-containing zinc finger protein